MSLGQISPSGAKVPIAGLNGLSGELVPSVSYYQKGTVAVPETAVNGYGTIQVTFGTAMPDTDYVVALGYGATTVAGMTYTVASKSKTGFVFVYTNTGLGTENSHQMAWQAFKLMTSEQTALDEAQIEANKSEIATLKTTGTRTTIWSGTATKGTTGMNFDASGYDIVTALLGGTECLLVSGSRTGSTGRKKFTATYAGRDTADGTPYEQYYLFDILGTGVVATCGWFDIGAKNTQNARLAGQKALELAKSGGSWSDPVWKTLADVETNVSCTAIYGYKFRRN